MSEQDTTEERFPVEYSRSVDRAALAKKVLAISEAIGYVQKDKQNEFHKYKYVSAEAILKRVQPELVKQGVLAVPRYFYIKSEGDLVTVECAITLIDTETGFEYLGSSAIGTGADKGDKGAMKAETAALKYAWTGLLSIATGDDPEADDSVDQRAEAPVTTIKMPKKVSFTEENMPLNVASAIPPEVKRAAEILGGTVTEIKKDNGGLYVTSLEPKEGTKGTYFKLTTSDGKSYNLFDKDHIQIARTAKGLDTGTPQAIYVETVKSGKYENVKAIGFQEERTA